MTVAEARANLERNIDTLVSVSVAQFRAGYLAVARENMTASIDELIACSQREVIKAEQAGLAEAASLAAETTSDPKAGGHA